MVSPRGVFSCANHASTLRPSGPSRRARASPGKHAPLLRVRPRRGRHLDRDRPASDARRRRGVVPRSAPDRTALQPGPPRRARPCHSPPRPRPVRVLCRAEPGLVGAVLIAHSLPAAPEELVRGAGAQVYCPDYLSLDEATVRRLHRAGARVVPYTVNEAGAWERLLAWGVDG